MFSKKIISWVVVVLWMLLIFNLSSQVGEQSNQFSTGITIIIVRAIEQVVPEANIDISCLNGVIRKISHFLIYLVLGFLVMNALLKDSKPRSKYFVVLALFICALYAILDEVHQLFVQGRGANLIDAIIDTSGSIVGIGIKMLLIPDKRFGDDKEK